MTKLYKLLVIALSVCLGLYCHFYILPKSIEFEYLFSSYEFHELPAITQYFFTTVKYYWLLSFIPLLSIPFKMFGYNNTAKFTIVLSVLMFPIIYRWAVVSVYAPIERMGNIF